MHQPPQWHQTQGHLPHNLPARRQAHSRRIPTRCRWACNTPCPLSPTPRLKGCRGLPCNRGHRTFQSQRLGLLCCKERLPACKRRWCHQSSQCSKTLDAEWKPGLLPALDPVLPPSMWTCPPCVKRSRASTEPAGNRHRRSDRCAALLCVVPTSEINLLRRLCGGKDPLLRVFLRTLNRRCFSA